MINRSLAAPPGTCVADTRSLASGSLAPLDSAAAINRSLAAPPGTCVGRLRRPGYSVTPRSRAHASRRS
jgi:hypothetical protein